MSKQKQVLQPVSNLPEMTAFLNRQYELMSGLTEEAAKWIHRPESVDGKALHHIMSSIKYNQSTILPAVHKQVAYWKNEHLSAHQRDEIDRLEHRLFECSEMNLKAFRILKEIIFGSPQLLRQTLEAEISKLEAELGGRNPTNGNKMGFLQKVRNLFT